MGCINGVIESRCLQNATTAHRNPQGKELVVRTRARGSFCLSKPWLRRERRAPHLPCPPRALQEQVGGCDLQSPSHISLHNGTLHSLSLRASFPQGSSCTVVSDSDGSHLGELWEMLQRHKSCAASMPWQGHQHCHGKSTGLEQSFIFPKPVSPAQIRRGTSQPVAATPDSRLPRASGLHKVQLAPKQQEHICAARKVVKKTEKKKNSQTLPKLQTETR